MKNLIEKIEKIIVSLKRQYQNCFEEIDCPLFTSDEIRGKISAYQDCLNLLNQYNLITAPKSIKLSEIVSKIQEQANEEIYFNRERKAIGYGEPDEDWRQSTWQPFVIFRDMKIVRVCMPMAEITKWVYTLWLAGTEIIDDIKEKE